MAPTLRSLPPPSKKRKLQPGSGCVQKIKELEDELIKAVTTRASLNCLVNLLDLTFQAEDPHDTSKGIYALYRTFVVIITHGKLSPQGGEAGRTVSRWLWERLNSYAEFLASLLKDEEKFLRISGLQILFSLQKHLSVLQPSPVDSERPQPHFHTSHFKKIVSALLLCPPSQRKNLARKIEDPLIDPDVRHLFHETWFSVHDDVRWFFLRESATLLSNASHDRQTSIATNLLSILENLNTFPTEPGELNSWWVPELGVKPPKKTTVASVSSDSNSDDPPEADEEDDWRKFFDEPAPTPENAAKVPGSRLHKMTIHQSVHSLSSHRAVFTRMWLTLLPRLSGNGDNDIEPRKPLIVKALNIMHRSVLPHLTRPILVMDWVGACVDYGGSVGLLALNALFVLMTEYNLDYPSFYTRLYAFLDRDVLHLKHRARFFRMIERFLSSTHLPATLLASFVKRLSRLSLTAPPAAIVMAIPLTYNILKKHPALMVMIHRTDEGDVDADPFDANETNPIATQALESSLWELLSHRNHHHATVSSLCKVFTEAFTKPGYSMEDFLDHTYGTLFDTEATRKIKKEPALAVEYSRELKVFPPVILEESDEETTVVGDAVTELWTF
ncbi:hypothetical protein K443DRAFT_129940 [Laccaria amethystina LaAM-08-1]|uniref:CCAAT-binding factor domain-containing protein n=1 Tax=Laccaria amethystina LaAM-08-1 TaxID=1095629 RepID=A0A0C9YDU6_9AGAR|nr:hypothetical protein K443DRAFT_129940 [Laccaria amethystina LaAM-08-1]